MFNWKQIYSDFITVILMNSSGTPNFSQDELVQDFWNSILTCIETEYLSFKNKLLHGKKKMGSNIQSGQTFRNLPTGPI